MQGLYEKWNELLSTDEWSYLQRQGGTKPKYHKQMVSIHLKAVADRE